MKEHMELAVRAARSASAVLLRRLHRERDVDFKGEINLVTDADRAAEDRIVSCLKAGAPGSAILTEEGGELRGENGLRWIVDPLDGTTNYAHGYPCFSVSIALEREGEIVLGVVFDPLRDELFTAVKGAGARLDGEGIHVSKTARLERSLLATGFPYDVRKSAEECLPPFRRMLLASQGVRRDGSAALDLAYVACGRFDGFWERGLYPWDTAAGSLLVGEAGGRVTDYPGRDWDPFRKETLASNGRIHAEMVSILSSA